METSVCLCTKTHMHSHWGAPSTIAFHSITYVNCLRSSFFGEMVRSHVTADHWAVLCWGKMPQREEHHGKSQDNVNAKLILYFPKIWQNCWRRAEDTTRNVDTLWSNNHRLCWTCTGLLFPKHNFIVTPGEDQQLSRGQIVTNSGLNESVWAKTRFDGSKLWLKMFIVCVLASMPARQRHTKELKMQYFLYIITFEKNKKTKNMKILRICF